jgi:hypothetical protein
MKLTEKCREDFEKWYFKTHCQTSLKYEELMPHHKEDVYGWFYGINLSFQYGIYVDFFDSVGIALQIYSTDYPKWFLNILQKGRYLTVVRETFKTRQEAREQAILKANEIYNENNR